MRITKPISERTWWPGRSSASRLLEYVNGGSFTPTSCLRPTRRPALSAACAPSPLLCAHAHVGAGAASQRGCWACHRATAAVEAAGQAPPPPPPPDSHLAQRSQARASHRWGPFPRGPTSEANRKSADGSVARWQRHHHGLKAVQASPRAPCGAGRAVPCELAYLASDHAPSARRSVPPAREPQVNEQQANGHRAWWHRRRRRRE